MYIYIYIVLALCYVLDILSGIKLKKENQDLKNRIKELEERE